MKGESGQFGVYEVELEHVVQKETQIVVRKVQLAQVEPALSILEVLV